MGGDGWRDASTSMGYYEEALMRNIQFAGATSLLGFSLAFGVAAQEPLQDAPAAPVEPPTHRADGRRYADLPVEAYAVVPGTKFLVRLEDELDTKETREKRHFKVTTLQPVAAGSRIYRSPGAHNRGHLSPAQSAGAA